MQQLRLFFKDWFASGEPWIWLNAAAVGISITAVLGILGLIAFKGFAHFWPSDVVTINYVDDQGDQRQVYGELIELDSISAQQFVESGGNREWLDPDRDVMDRWLVKTGNRRIAPPDFRWVFDRQINSKTPEPGVIVLERVEWGNAY
ncbi:MAG: phosphate ABC transporter, permease protein PstA, partial [Pseudomonadota bacterium]